MFGDVVCGVDRGRLEAPLTRRRAEAGVDFDHQLSEVQLEGLVDELEELFERYAAEPFRRPGRAGEAGGCRGVRELERQAGGHLRSLHDISGELGTAATVQCMVFGNLGAGSATGVAFSRDPSTGAPEPMGSGCRMPRERTSLPGCARRGSCVALWGPEGFRHSRRRCRMSIASSRA